MKISITQESARVTVTVFTVSGMINLGTVGELEDEAREYYEGGMRNLLIDLSEVVSLTSAGLRALLGISKMLEDEEGGGEAGGVGKSEHLKLLNPKPQIRGVLNIASFDSLFDIFEDREKALAAF